MDSKDREEMEGLWREFCDNPTEPWTRVGGLAVIAMVAWDRGPYQSHDGLGSAIFQNCELQSVRLECLPVLDMGRREWVRR